MKHAGYVILDRDGTINVERHYLSNPDDLELIPGVLDGLLSLQEINVALIVVTNQSGIARGYLDHGRLECIHSRLRQLLAWGGVAVDGIYYCPHHPDDGCQCRKPNPGLVLQAATQFGFQPQQAFFIGDKPCDTELGKAVGGTSFLVRTGYGAHSEQLGTSTADYIVDDLAAASRKIRSLIEQRSLRAA